jgi:hypothetical protein
MWLNGFKPRLPRDALFIEQRHPMGKNWLRAVSLWNRGFVGAVMDKAC